MEKNYCVFWFPCIYHTSINERFQRFEIETSITDFGSDDVILKVSIDYQTDKQIQSEKFDAAKEDDDLIKSSLIFEIYKNRDGKKQNIFKSFTLDYVDHSNNGMVVYSYQKPDDYPESNDNPSFDDELKTVFYHCAKLLFHNHEVQTHRDYGLTAFIPTNLNKFDPKKSIHDPDNEAIKWFFEQYETIFIEYSETASGLLRETDALIEKFKKRITKKKKNPTEWGVYKSLNQYGIKDFYIWYKYKKSEVAQCQKELLSTLLYLNPPYKRKRRREYYINRCIKIGEALKSRLSGNPNVINEYEIVYNKYKEIYERLKKWGTVPWKQITQIDIYPIEYMLLNCEIDLGLINMKKWELFRNLLKTDAYKDEYIHRATKNIGGLCEGALTEYVYCKTLLESKYNTHVTHCKFNKDNKSEQEIRELDNGRKKACNIRNSIRYVETVKYRCENAHKTTVLYNFKKSDTLSRNAKRWTITGIVLSVIGLALTAVGIILSTKGCGCY